MVNQRQKKAKQQKRKRANAPTYRFDRSVVGIPAHYPTAPGDTITVPFKFTSLLEVVGGVPVGKLLVLGNGTTTGDYIFFDDVCTQFAALKLISSRWMVSNLRVEVRATGIGGSANTFIAASYIPSNSSVDNPPTSLVEVSQAIHYAESSLGTTGSFVVKPTDYFNDWRQITDTDDSDAQAGLIQLYGSGGGGSGTVTAGVYTVSGLLHFCGYRL